MLTYEERLRIEAMKNLEKSKSEKEERHRKLREFIETHKTDNIGATEYNNKINEILHTPVSDNHIEDECDQKLFELLKTHASDDPEYWKKYNEIMRENDNLIESCNDPLFRKILELDKNDPDYYRKMTKIYSDAYHEKLSEKLGYKKPNWVWTGVYAAIVVPLLLIVPVIGCCIIGATIGVLIAYAVAKA